MSDAKKKYKIVIHDKAAQMMYTHIRFVANVSIAAASNLKDVFSDAIISLEDMPGRCPVYPTQYTFGSYRQLIAGRYKIIFTINEKEKIVQVKYILDSRQETDLL